MTGVTNVTYSRYIYRKYHRICADRWTSVLLCVAPATVVEISH